MEAARGRQRLLSKGGQVLIVASVSACSLIPFTSARAQSQGEMQQPSRKDVASESPGEIVVSARRTSERLQDVPVSVTVVSGEALAQRSITSLEDLRLIAPTVSFDRAIFGSGISLSIRGVSSSFQDQGIEQSILIDYDGVPMSRGRVLGIAMFDVARVEVLKGPQALFFGKNSPGGVVSIGSAKPTDTTEGFARVAYEFHSIKPSFEAALSGPLAPNLNGRVAVFASRSEGYIKNTFPGMNDPIRTDATGGGFAVPERDRLGANRSVAGRATLEYTGANATVNLKVLYGESRGDNMNLTELMGCGGGRTVPQFLGVADPFGDCKLNGRVSRARFPRIEAEAWPEAKFTRCGPTDRWRGSRKWPVATIG